MSTRDLTFRQAHDRVDAWISQFQEGYFPPLVQVARLVEELGELARALSHETGVKKPKPGEEVHSTREELGDILFVLTCLANAQGIDMADAFQETLQKFDRRDTSRWTLKEPAHE